MFSQFVILFLHACLMSVFFFLTIIRYIYLLYTITSVRVPSSLYSYYLFVVPVDTKTNIFEGMYNRFGLRIMVFNATFNNISTIA